MCYRPGARKPDKSVGLLSSCCGYRSSMPSPRCKQVTRRGAYHDLQYTLESCHCPAGIRTSTKNLSIAAKRTMFTRHSFFFLLERRTKAKLYFDMVLCGFKADAGPGMWLARDERVQVVGTKLYQISPDIGWYTYVWPERLPSFRYIPAHMYCVRSGTDGPTIHSG